MAMIVLLVLVAVVVAVASAASQLARANGSGVTPDVARLLARRVGALLLVVVAFVAALGNGQAVSGATYGLFAGVAALIMAGLGAFWLYRDQESA